MNTMLKADTPLYLGIDGGGSKCRAVIVSSDQHILGDVQLVRVQVEAIIPINCIQPQPRRGEQDDSESNQRC